MTTTYEIKDRAMTGVDDEYMAQGSPVCGVKRSGENLQKLGGKLQKQETSKPHLMHGLVNNVHGHPRIALYSLLEERPKEMLLPLGLTEYDDDFLYFACAKDWLVTVNCKDHSLRLINVLKDDHPPPITLPSLDPPRYLKTYFKHKWDDLDAAMKSSLIAPRNFYGKFILRGDPLSTVGDVDCTLVVMLKQISFHQTAALAYFSSAGSWSDGLNSVSVHEWKPAVTAHSFWHDAVFHKGKLFVIYSDGLLDVFDLKEPAVEPYTELLKTYPLGLSIRGLISDPPWVTFHPLHLVDVGDHILILVRIGTSVADKPVHSPGYFKVIKLSLSQDYPYSVPQLVEVFELSNNALVLLGENASFSLPVADDHGVKSSRIYFADRTTRFQNISSLGFYDLHSEMVHPISVPAFRKAPPAYFSSFVPQWI